MMQTLLLWKDLAAYSGPSFSTKRHSHFFHQLCLGRDGLFRLRGRNGKWYSYQAAFIPSGISHETEKAESPFILILIDPLSFGAEVLDGRTISPGEPAIGVSDLFEWKMIATVSAFLGKSVESAREEMLQIVAKYVIANQQKVDARILASVERLHATERNIPLRELAAIAGLSSGRFRHMFREQMGIAFSAYRLWMKTRKSMLFLAENPELVQAAYEGGFADQAHFSRIFRRSFGMTPSEFKRNPSFSVQIFAG